MHCCMLQARAKAAEEEAAAIRAAAEQEKEQLNAQVQESASVVGQWQHAYEELQKQYEAAQVMVRSSVNDTLLPTAFICECAGLPCSILLFKCNISWACQISLGKNK